MHPAGETLRRMDAGRRVRALREALLSAGISMSYLAPDSVNNPDLFDDHVDAAVRSFQQSRGLIVDGVAGPDTLRALAEAQFRFGDRVLALVEGQQPIRGDDVAELQRHLSHLGFYYGHIDGEFNVRTRYAVAELQNNLGIPGTGVCDQDTIRAMARVNRAITPSQAFALRDYERLDRSTAALRGRLIALSTGSSELASPHAVDRLTSRPLTEAMVAADIGQRVERILREFGAGVVSRASAFAGVDGGGERVPSLSLDLHCDWLDQQAASGIAAFYWGLPGTGEARSPIGHRAAILLMKELAARTGMDSLGVHGRTWDTLKLSGIPSVGLDLGYLSNRGDAERLADPVFRQTVADSIVIGIQRLYLLEEEDQPTGTLALDDVFRFNPAEVPEERRVAGL
ncbi:MULTISPECIES: peptidoglycan-binding protein [Arthrobacter]|uniref:Peptidoglycan-binding protein n=1 Tax=Arthrobacter sunyaminii TaxID=2816859 RepID=A0A975S5R0_9MICC|nr:MULTISPECIES: peptidoglycan-binding protein [Arthrobacter]MBO0896930.1 peptidoglycan-binding protein [Arthrobacter sunyaminii]MBO0909414.1 peptidoglycan-binding protein [Arthrobacter sunyaminii]QWQ36266.1 peptidoglycan-binding protein [Arthrobacter sunyaminii]